ncbi:MAG: VanZ family protein [Flavobacteriales bacterium]|nr:VanZ family protein [Flavobacteriales bacterium]
MKGAGRWAVLWALLILVLCLIPGKDLPDWDWFDLFDLDKPVHFTLFGVQMVLTALAFHPQYADPAGRSKALGLAFGACVAYGGLTEVMQGALLMGRTADITDFIANTLGCLAGLVYLRRRAKRAGAPEGRTDP